MSAHSARAKARHPETRGFRREAFRVAHVTIEVIDHPENGATFALIAGDALLPKDRAPLFSGHITRGMGTELRRLAHRIDELEAGLPVDGA